MREMMKLKGRRIEKRSGSLVDDGNGCLDVLE